MLVYQMAHRRTRKVALVATASAAAWLMLMAAGRTAQANSVTVQDAASLTSALTGAQAGDVITLADGAYAMHSVNCTQNASPQSPIVVKAGHPGKAIVTFDDGVGNAVVGFQVSGSDWHFDGMTVKGGCANDTDCEHAFHVVGGALRFVLTNSELVDFNAELKVNAVPGPNGTYLIPDEGLVEGNEVHDTRARNTTNPVDKLDIDTVSGWVVRGNFVHDASANASSGGSISYLGYMKGGGKNGIFEGNLVVCSRDIPPQPNEARLGLSFGGGGTGPQYCAPAFNANVPCTVEHTNGLMRNNIIASCSDVGIYLNESAQTTIAYNTLIANNGIDCRFTSTSGTLQGNVMSATPHLRNGGTCSDTQNLENVAEAQFDSWFTAPLVGDLSLTAAGDRSALIGKGSAVAAVTDDYCARARTGAFDLGALQVSLGNCETLTPYEGDGGLPPVDGGEADGGIGADGGFGADAGRSPDGGVVGFNDAGGEHDGGVAAAPPGGSCGCQQATTGGGSLGLLSAGLVFLTLRVRRKRGSKSGVAA